MSHVLVSNVRRPPTGIHSATPTALHKQPHTAEMGSSSTCGLGGDQIPLTESIKKAGNESYTGQKRVFRVGDGILSNGTDMAYEQGNSTCSVKTISNRRAN
jgi:hypothetical protein